MTKPITSTPPRLQILPYTTETQYRENVETVLNKIIQSGIDTNKIIITEGPHSDIYNRHDAKEYAKHYNLKFIPYLEIDNLTSRQVEEISKQKNITYTEALKQAYKDKEERDKLPNYIKKPNLPLSGYIIISIGTASLGILSTMYIFHESSNSLIHIQNSVKPNHWKDEVTDNMEDYVISLEDFQIPSITN